MEHASKTEQARVRPGSAASRPGPAVDVSPDGDRMRAFARAMNGSPPVQRLQSASDQIQRKGLEEEELTQMQSAAPVNRSGLPDNLKSGIESLSGLSMDHVRVHRNSSRPAQLQAHAFAQGSDIHLAPGQDRHLPHEAWHVVQQAQGRVKPTMQMTGGVPVNDDAGLEREADVMGGRAMGLGLPGGAQVQLKALALSGAVVQRAGVKAELAEAQTNFEGFLEESELIDETRTAVATAIYNTYKPELVAKREHFSDKVAHQGVNPNFDRDVAYEKAVRLKHWTQTSINAASRIYEELIAATGYNDDQGIGLEEITFGMDTDMEPDVFASNDMAIESKRVDSVAQGSVDAHITKVSEQLEKRVTNSIFGPPVPVTKWVAHIKIANPDNPWPYTPVAYKKAVKANKLNPQAVGSSRIERYENANINIKYVIDSENPGIGKFTVMT